MKNLNENDTIDVLVKDGEETQVFSVFRSDGSYECITYKVKPNMEDPDEVIYDKLTENIEDEVKFPSLIQAINAGFKKLKKSFDADKILSFTGSYKEAASLISSENPVIAVSISDYL